MDSSLTFSDQEIQEELARLGYSNIPYEKLRQFQQDLNHLVLAERSKATSHSDSFGSVNEEDVKASPEQRRDLQPSPMVMPLDRNIAVNVVPRTWQYLTREDQEEDDVAQDPQPRAKPSVPGTFSLFELPARALILRDDVSETDSEIRRMKRKTLRKNDEGAKFIDESMSDIDTGCVIEAHQRMQRMVLRDLDPLQPRRSQSACSSDQVPYRLSPDDPRPPSVIYSSEHPHMKNLRRADPVTRYQQMQQVWATQKAPGENKHSGLRWNVREQMLTQFVPDKKPQRRYIPNDYVPPTDKQRKALRWKVRMDMA